MKIQLNGEMLNALKRRLDLSEDAESLSKEEYALDLYDLEPPICLELSLTEDGVDVLAAAEMEYHEESDGYYLKAQRFDGENIERILRDWITR